jgi:hypothetical protein
MSTNDPTPNNVRQITLAAELERSLSSAQGLARFLKLMEDAGADVNRPYDRENDAAWDRALGEGRM